MTPNLNSGLLFDREEYKQTPTCPEWAGCLNVDGKIVAVVGRKVIGDFGDMLSIQVVPWETVHLNPKIYGFTEKQAKAAEMQEIEF